MAEGGAREVTERVQDKAAQVDGLRRVSIVDNRETGVLLGELWGEPHVKLEEPGATMRPEP